MTDHRSRHLLTATKLRAALDTDHPPVLLDVRWSLDKPDGYPEYAAGHISSAHYLGLENDLSDHSAPADQGRHPLPDLGALQEKLRLCGIDDNSAVVVYDAGTSTGAARAWWVLRWAGLRGVMVLDGGLGAWTEAGGALSTAADTAELTVRVGTVTLTPGNLPTLDAEGAASLAATGGLIDARAAERFTGAREPVDPVAGHIPGAINVASSLNSGPEGFRATDELRALYDEAGIGTDSPVGVYCGSGVTAANTVLALALTGQEAALFAPSWSGWIAEDRETAQGQ